MDLSGLKIVVDCANGAAYKVAPRVLADLGAEIVPIGCSPNGRNINDGCGSTAPELLQLTVPGVRAHVGIALDGDGDRLVMVDHLGRIVDGDQLLYVIAARRTSSGHAARPGGRHGDEQPRPRARAARELGIEFRRAAVGDRYVLAHAARDRRRARRRDLRAHPVPRQDHDRRRAGQRAAGAGGHEADAAARWPSWPPAWRSCPQVLLNVEVAKRFDPIAVPAIAGGRARASRRSWRARAAWCCAPRAPSRVIRVMVEGGTSGAHPCRDELAAGGRAAAG